MPGNREFSIDEQPEDSRRGPSRYCEVVSSAARRMSKESKVRAVTMIVIVVAALLVIGRKAGWQLATSGGLGCMSPQAESAPQAESRPQDTIYRMLDAAGRGDASAYIACYSGAMRRRLEQSHDEMTAGGFARYLTENNRQIKGIAIAEPQTLSGGEVEVRVEFVYQDRNEAQRFLLAESAGEWTITRVSAAERVETPVPYGTPVH